MKNILFIAALIFSAATLNTFAQSPHPSPSAPDAAASPIAASTSSAPDWKLPVGPRPALNFVQQQATYVRPDSKTRFKRYVNGTVGPYALARQVLGAGIATSKCFAGFGVDGAFHAPSVASSSFFSTS